MDHCMNSICGDEDDEKVQDVISWFNTAWKSLNTGELKHNWKHLLTITLSHGNVHPAIIQSVWSCNMLLGRCATVWLSANIFIRLKQDVLVCAKTTTVAQHWKMCRIYLCWWRARHTQGSSQFFPVVSKWTHLQMLDQQKSLHLVFLESSDRWMLWQKCWTEREERVNWIYPHAVSNISYNRSSQIINVNHSFTDGAFECQNPWQSMCCQKHTCKLKMILCRSTLLCQHR